MPATHRDHAQALIDEAAVAYAELMSRLPPNLRASIPVDAQGVTQAIDYVAQAAGLSAAQRRALIRPHALNPAVLHARVFGAAPLDRGTVIGSFVEGARVRAKSLSALADAVGGPDLGHEVRRLLVEHPLAADATGDEAVRSLRSTYAAHERAAVMIAASLDREES